MTKLPRVNQSECCGCGLCVISLPEVFRVAPGGKSEAFAPKNAPIEDIQKTIDDCPCMAILWFKANN